MTMVCKYVYDTLLIGGCCGKSASHAVWGESGVVSRWCAVWMEGVRKKLDFYSTFTPPFTFTLHSIESWLTKTFRLLS